MSDDAAALPLALAIENVELRQQLATAQDMLMETAIDAGHLHARIEALQAELAQVQALGMPGAEQLVVHQQHDQQDRRQRVEF